MCHTAHTDSDCNDTNAPHTAQPYNYTCSIRHWTKPHFLFRENKWQNRTFIVFGANARRYHQASTQIFLQSSVCLKKQNKKKIKRKKKICLLSFVVRRLAVGVLCVLCGDVSEMPLMCLYTHIRRLWQIMRYIVRSWYVVIYDCSTMDDDTPGICVFVLCMAQVFDADVEWIAVHRP